MPAEPVLGVTFFQSLQLRSGFSTLPERANISKSGGAVGVHFHAAELREYPRIQNIAVVGAVGSRLGGELIQPSGVAGGYVEPIRRVGKGGRLADGRVGQVDKGAVFVMR